MQFPISEVIFLALLSSVLFSTVQAKANGTRTGEEEESIKRLFSSSSAVSVGDSSYRFRSVVRETRQVIVNYIQLWLDLPAPSFSLGLPLEEEAKVSFFSANERHAEGEKL
jgi:hypothetical protein